MNLNRFNQLLESTIGDVRPLLNEQKVATAKILSTRFFDNKDDGATGEGVFRLAGGMLVSSVKNYYVVGTSTDFDKVGGDNYINFNFIKIITGKNEGQVMKLNLNGKPILDVPLSNNNGQDGVSYYVMNRIQIENFDKPNNLITFRVDNSQSNALSINKMFIEVNLNV